MKKLTVWAVIIVMSLSVSLSGAGEWMMAGDSQEACAASYPKLKTIDYTKTGNQKKDIVGFARTQIGYTEGSNNNTYFGKWFGCNYNPWCAMFVSWCAAKAGVSKSVVPRIATADRSWAKKQGVYHKSKHWGGSYTPKKGDLIYFSWSVRDYADHIGIVKKTATVNGTKYVYTIEGNKRDKVVECTYAVNNKYILGYASPKYKTTTVTTTTEEVPTTYTLKYRDGLAETANDEEDKLIEPATGTFGKNLTLSSEKFERTGYKYSKWQVYRENDSGQLIYLCVKDDNNEKEKWKAEGSIPSGYSQVRVKTGGKLKIRTGVTGTIYASPVWKLKTYSVTYDANGGKKAPDPQTKKYGKTLTLSTTVPVRTGYTFLGWAKTADASEPAFSAGGTYKKNKKLALYAVWEPVTKAFKVKVTRSAGLNIRTGPGLDYEISGLAEKGTKLKIKGVDDGWGRIKGTDTWVMLKYTEQVE